MVGIDLVEVSRVDTSDKFLSRIANSAEVMFIRKTNSTNLRQQKIASLFCVKEAVMKALELGANSKVSFLDIELCHEESGKPFVKLYGVALEKLNSAFKGKNIEVSLSHTKEYATAIAIIV